MGVLASRSMHNLRKKLRAEHKGMRVTIRPEISGDIRKDKEAMRSLDGLNNIHWEQKKKDLDGKTPVTDSPKPQSGHQSPVVMDQVFFEELPVDEICRGITDINQLDKDNMSPVAIDKIAFQNGKEAFTKY